MGRRGSLNLALGPMALLVLAPPVYANSISPYVWFWPGVLPLSLVLALPATVLAAVCERPFVSRAGVTRHALCCSLQANFVSLALGYLALPFSAWALYSPSPLALLLPFLAIAVSICSEGFYYQFRALPAAARLKWKWIIAGNVFSSLLLMAIPPLTLALKEADPYLPYPFEPYEDALSWAAALGSLAAFGLGFLIPLRWKRKDDLPDAESGLDRGSRA